MICLICNYQFKSALRLGVHLRKHNITSKEYYDKFLKKENEGTCQNKSCQNLTTYINLSKGYHAYCSCTCMCCLPSWLIKRTETSLKKFGETHFNKTKEGKEKISKIHFSFSKEKNEQIRLAREKTSLKKYGVKNFMLIPEMADKVNEKQRLKFGWINYKEDYPKFKKYRNKTMSLTRKVAKNLFSKEQLLKIGKCGVEGALQIDHLYSVRDGFENNIPSKILCHPKNLQLIPWEENNKKRNKSSISLEKLMESVQC